jgi:hypothetical protein
MTVIEEIIRAEEAARAEQDEIDEMITEAETEED